MGKHSAEIFRRF